MERPELLKRLEQLALQVWHVTAELARNRKVISQLDAAGMDTKRCAVIGFGLENLLIVYLQDREKLRAEAAKLEEGPSQEPPSSGHS
jgi:hypothetical protein